MSGQSLNHALLGTAAVIVFPRQAGAYAAGLADRPWVLARLGGISQVQALTGRCTVPRGSSPKRERQYEHVKESARDRGESPKRATEIAARTVNKERARSGESRTASNTSTRDISSGRRGGLRSHSGAAGRTKDQLYAEAQKRDIPGRSSMNKAQLERALAR